MNTEALAALVNLGSGGAVIAVVVVFLRFISKRDAETQMFFKTIRDADGEATGKLTAVIQKLVERVEGLENRFGEHDAAEMELLRSIAERPVSRPVKRTAK